MNPMLNHKMNHLLIFSVLIGLGSCFGFAGTVHADDSTWHLGENLEKGDYISYRLCHWDYNDCQEFQIEIWIDGAMTLGVEHRWTAQVTVTDDDEQIHGSIEFGKESAEPFGRNDGIKTYRDVFKSSVAWFASSTSENSPANLVSGEFVEPDKWTTIGIVPQTFSILDSQKVLVPAGIFDATVLQSDITPQNKIWIADDIPFPVKAKVYLDRVCDSGCPLEYSFELLNYSKNMTYGSFIEETNNPHTEYLSPLEQFKNDIPFHEIKCNNDMQLTQKYDGSPACVSPETYLDLIKRGWVSNIIVAIQSRDMFVDPEDATSSYMGKITPTINDFKNVLSEPYEIDEIFSKFGEPHDDIGSGIHIYVYELNDLTEVWIGYVDEILYVKHMDTGGNKLEDLFVKKTKSETTSEDNFDLPELKLFLGKYPNAEIIVDQIEYGIHKKHYMYVNPTTEDSVNLVVTKHIAAKNMNSILSCHLDQYYNKTYGMIGSEKIIKYLQDHDCLSESNIGNLEPIIIRESFLELGFGENTITVFITDMSNHSTESMKFFAASQEWDVISISNLIGAHNRLPDTSIDDRRGPGTMVSETIKAGTYIKQNDEKEFWYTIDGNEDQIITIELQDHEFDRITFVSENSKKWIEKINEMVDSRN